MNPGNLSAAPSGDRRSYTSDIAALLLLSTSLWLALQSNRNIYTGLVLFMIGLMCLSLSRRTHSSQFIARAARGIYTLTPTAVILTFVAVTLSDFGRYLTQADFGMFYSTALQLRTDPAHLYDIEAQNRMLAVVTGGLENHYLSFPYPPFVAALFVPLSYLSFRNAYLTMLGCNLVLLVFIVYILCMSVCTTRDQRLTLILAASVSLPLYINLALGQMAFVGLLLFSLFICDVLGQKTTRAGLWVGLLAYKITLVPLAFLVLLTQRAWKGMGVAIAAMFFLFVVSLALVGIPGLLGNLNVMTMMMSASQIPRMQSLRALTYYVGMPGWTFWPLAATVVAAWIVVNQRARHPKWVLAAAILANLLVAPYVQSYDLCLGLLAIALAISSYSRMPDWRRSVFLLLAFLPPFVSVTGQVTGRNWPAAPITILALFVYCLYRAGGGAVSDGSGELSN